jgi:hypothetical protein
MLAAHPSLGYPGTSLKALTTEFAIAERGPKLVSRGPTLMEGLQGVAE